MIVRNTTQLLSLHLRKITVTRQFCNEIKSDPKQTWDLYAGVLLERLPIITKALNPLEAQVQKMLNDIEFENSLKSDHEIRHEREQIQAELIKRGEVDVDLDVDSTKQTAQDFKDACTDEAEKFKFAPRITEADKKNDLKSLQRKLDETLILIAKQTLGKNQVTALPQGKWIQGETLRQTAERVLKEAAGSELKVQFYGNAPCGFYKYKYPKEERTESVGAKVFFFRAVIRDDNNANLDKKVTFEWRTKDELGQVLKNPYYKNVSQFML
uniref:Large ribosomal subunit protein mL46 n=1 Tax=Culicoides sonorensis TaxID=179676 RepID=A0A336K3T5_CULSO